MNMRTVFVYTPNIGLVFVGEIGCKTLVDFTPCVMKRDQGVFFYLIFDFKMLKY